MITLHKIIRYLSDEKFVTGPPTVTNVTNHEENLSSDSEKGNRTTKYKSKDIFTMLETTIIDFSVLAMYDYQQQNMFPHNVKEVIPLNFYRFGIKNLHQQNMVISNISFINTLNILLKPDLKAVNAESQYHYYNLMKEFICNKISANYQIEKKRNNKKTQDKNNTMVADIKTGTITPHIIQYICNLFEFNLCVCHLNDNVIDYYYCFPESFAYLNPFKPLFFMSCLNSNYEPILPPDVINDYPLMNFNCILHNDSDKFRPFVPIKLHALYMELAISVNIGLAGYIKLYELYLSIDEPVEPYIKPTNGIQECVKPK
jgi:hypothetical protein